MLIPKDKHTEPQEKQIKGKSSLFNDLALLVLARNGNKHVRNEVYTFEIGKGWVIALNGFAEARFHQPRNCMPKNLTPLSFTIWFDGLYVGWANPFNEIMLEERLTANPKTRFDIGNLERIVQEEIKRLGKATS